MYVQLKDTLDSKKFTYSWQLNYIDKSSQQELWDAQFVDMEAFEQDSMNKRWKLEGADSLYWIVLNHEAVKLQINVDVIKTDSINLFERRSASLAHINVFYRSFIERIDGMS
ncbi:MAG: hypothetical protein GW809_03075 [Bacteroidetes bacterium]|nr:hypothetical protein [Bacteroidota bacterium]